MSKRFDDEKDRILMAAAVQQNLKQLGKLLEVEPPLPDEELAHRMALPVKDLRRMLKLLRKPR